MGSAQVLGRRSAAAKRSIHVPRKFCGMPEPSLGHSFVWLAPLASVAFVWRHEASTIWKTAGGPRLRHWADLWRVVCRRAADLPCWDWVQPGSPMGQPLFWAGSGFAYDGAVVGNRRDLISDQRCRRGCPQPDFVPAAPISVRALDLGHRARAPARSFGTGIGGYSPRLHSRQHSDQLGSLGYREHASAVRGLFYRAAVRLPLWFNITSSARNCGIGLNLSAPSPD
jgi:hypothetical protein